MYTYIYMNLVMYQLLHLPLHILLAISSYRHWQQAYWWVSIYRSFGQPFYKKNLQLHLNLWLLHHCLSHRKVNHWPPLQEILWGAFLFSEIILFYSCFFHFPLSAWYTLWTHLALEGRSMLDIHSSTPYSLFAELGSATLKCSERYRYTH